MSGTEVGDHEIDLTRAGGTQVDVQLDDAFAVVGSQQDDEVGGE